MSFLEYPGGAGGTALLLLRASAASLLFVVLSDLHGTNPSIIVIYFVIASLVIGFVTRLAAAICGVISMILLLWWPDVPVLLIVTHVMDAVALVLLGPGAISLDARFYGRRTLGAFSTPRTKE